jgi:hypothetical protein
MTLDILSKGNGYTAKHGQQQQQQAGARTATPDAAWRLIPESRDSNSVSPKQLATKSAAANALIRERAGLLPKDDNSLEQLWNHIQAKHTTGVHMDLSLSSAADLMRHFTLETLNLKLRRRAFDVYDRTVKRAAADAAAEGKTLHQSFQQDAAWGEVWSAFMAAAAHESDRALGVSNVLADIRSAAPEWFQFSNELLSNALRALAKSGDADFALKLNTELQAGGFPGTQAAQTELLKCLLKGERAEEAATVLAQMLGASMRPSDGVVLAVLEAACRVPSNTAAALTLGLLRVTLALGVKLDQAHLEKIFEVAGRWGDPALAGEAWTATSTLGLQQTDAMLNGIACAYANADQHMAALKAVMQIVAAGKAVQRRTIAAIARKLEPSVEQIDDAYYELAQVRTEGLGHACIKYT